MALKALQEVLEKHMNAGAEGSDELEGSDYQAV